jgi:hypothetical protein
MESQSVTGFGNPIKEKFFKIEGFSDEMLTRQYMISPVPEFHFWIKKNPGGDSGIFEIQRI